MGDQTGMCDSKGNKTYYKKLIEELENRKDIPRVFPKEIGGKPIFINSSNCHVSIGLLEWEDPKDD